MTQAHCVNDPVRELRLALVCYGGVSLAIYMHGTTKEIHKLVLASQAYEENQAENPFTSEGNRTEAAYWKLLKRKQEQDRDGVRTRVVVDVVSGTSAGGINGICLATVLAHDTSQDTLRDLWLVQGDIGRLWQPGLSEKIPWRLRAVWWAMRTVTNISGAKPPLRGDRMCRLLYDALDGMTDDGASTLVPEGLSLKLFVTTTDLRGYRRFTRIKDRLIDDITHRVVMRFRYDAVGADSTQSLDDFAASKTGSLAFAARATSSFPGAFPPIGLPTFTQDLAADGKNRVVNHEQVSGFLPAYRAPFDAVDNAWFVDGGVLDNKPFGHAIGAIVDQAASTEVTRWLVYLEPDPSPPPTDGNSDESSREPSLLGTVIPSLSGIPRSEPILDELASLRRFNERVDDVRRLVAPQIETLPGELQEVKTLVDGTTPPTTDEMGSAMRQVHAQARANVGTTYPTYLRLKLRSIHQSLSNAIATACRYPPESAQAAFIRAVLGQWQDARYGDDPTTADALDYINRNDVPYRVRRLRFVVQGINDRYGDSTPEQRQELNIAKRQIYQSIDLINGALAPDRVLEELSGVNLFADAALGQWLATDPDPMRLAEDQEAKLSNMMTALGNYLDHELEGSSIGLLEHYNDISRDWDVALRENVLVRFLGFPLWDAAVFPLMSLSDIQQFAPIQVARFSPVGATRLGNQGADKLKGTGFGHFGAFFSRSARENDYLWGRLDGADQLLHLLDLNESDDANEVFASIIAEEEPSLSKAKGVLDLVRELIPN